MLCRSLFKTCDKARHLFLPLTIFKTTGLDTYAAVALSRVADGAPLSLTLVSGEANQPTLGETTTHGLSGNSPDAIIKSISDLIGHGSFALALPTNLPYELLTAFRYTGIHQVFIRHPVAFVQLNPFDITDTDDGPIDVLFVDTTTGQAAADFSSAELEGRWGWFITSELGRKTVLPEVPLETLSTQDVLDRLVVPTVPESRKPHQIAILRPEGESSELESALNILFPSARVKWVTLMDLSRGAALWIHLRPPFTGPVTESMCLLEPVQVPTGIVLTNGRIATAVSRHRLLPLTERIVLTTSHDNQTTATLQFVNGRKPCGRVVLQGITPKPKGAVRIQVSTEVAWDWKTVVTVEELGSENKKVAELASVGSKEEIEEFIAQNDSGEIAQIYYDGPDMGELPA